MNTFALFDDQHCEKIELEFLKPSSDGTRVDLMFLSNVPANMKMSLDKAVKEIYLFSSRYSNRIPDRVSIMFRGFERNAKGNSTDLAFTVSFLTYLIEEGCFSTAVNFKNIYVTGVIGKRTEIQRITGLKEKIAGAIQSSGDHSQNILLYPYENYDELQVLMKDVAFRQKVRESNLQLYPVRKLTDIFKIFHISPMKENKKLPVKWLVGISACGLALLIILTTTIFIKNAMSQGNNNIFSTPKQTLAITFNLSSNNTANRSGISSQTPSAVHTLKAPEQTPTQNNTQTPQQTQTAPNSTPNQTSPPITPTSTQKSPVLPTLKSGSSGTNVYVLQFLLHNKGYNISVNGQFDTGTQSTVKNLQRDCGLSVDGEVGTGTWKVLFVIVQYGSNNDAVRALQKVLAAKGYSVAVDGDFGSATKGAVIDFQNKSKISSDGIVGNNTWKFLIGS